MHIFIDESGNFTGYRTTPKISAVGALVIRDDQIDSICSEYTHLRSKLPKDKGEVKGKQLSETQIRYIIDFLLCYDVIFELNAVDTGTHTVSGLEVHRDGQAQAIIAGISPTHGPEFRDSVFEMKDKVLRFSLQLYLQSVVTFDLVYRVIDHSTLYHAQRNPAELAKFHWIIDAKGRSNPITPWEQWWSFFVMPSIQSKTNRKPFSFLEGADYSYFERFDSEWLDWAAPGVNQDSKSSMIDAKLLMTESFRFSDQPEPGLELVDILCSAARRAMLGKLGFSGWQKLPALMIARKEHYIGMLFINGLPPRANADYYKVLKYFKNGGKPMLC